MTQWYKIRCETCNQEVTEAFTTFNAKMSLYCLAEKEKERAGEFLYKHGSTDHKLVILKDPE